jgi:hypothetical protein
VEWVKDNAEDENEDVLMMCVAKNFIDDNELHCTGDERN